MEFFSYRILSLITCTEKNTNEKQFYLEFNCLNENGTHDD